MEPWTLADVEAALEVVGAVTRAGDEELVVDLCLVNGCSTHTPLPAHITGREVRESRL